MRRRTIRKAGRQEIEFLTLPAFLIVKPPSANARP
jgi:hypothetical protein